MNLRINIFKIYLRRLTDPCVVRIVRFRRNFSSTYTYVILSIKKSRSNTVRIPWLRRSGAVGGGGGPLGGQCRRLGGTLRYRVVRSARSKFDARTKTTTIRRLVGPAASYLADRRLHVWYFTRFSMSSWSLRLRWGSSRQVSHVFSELLWLAIVIPCQW